VDLITTDLELDGPVRAAIRASLVDLVPSEAKVAEVFLGDPRQVMHQSVTEVAEAAGVAPSTVVRACQRLGYKGFQALKLALAQDSSNPVRRLQGDIADDDAPAQVLAKVLSSGEDALHGASQTLDPAAFEAAVTVLHVAGRVLFAGVGTSAPLAQDAAYRFLTVGLQAEAPADVHVQHVRARLLTPADVCVAVSHTGATQETLAVVQAAADAGAATIAITSFVRSPLTDLAQVALVAGSRELSYRIEAMASRIAHLTVLDALLVAVAIASPDRTALAQTATANVLSEHRF
jgi:DNA-binding MurR/RpiR family transcriptional regulator